MWWAKLIVIALLIAAVVALGSALFGLVKGDRHRLTMKSLAWRVSFSAALLVFLGLSHTFGWIEPHDVNPHTRGGVPINTLEQTQRDAADSEGDTTDTDRGRSQRRSIDDHPALQ